ncbi:hypothetical protein RMN57_14215 [Kitasatospora sp. CM 4170]|uniref:LPXTG cell wall anchor domain-containing protein n=1 Tax=Kitasatospora aburaviensis TaxID=67265 RepID=A0ABW1ET16_9ACTN|nr:hypothetical protein [Kitasatospora sp. CM 4170]WNM45792.1 hypothetical protein RMN57_14215 [Kitasatospora sp. CM 4170]
MTTVPSTAALLADIAPDPGGSDGSLVAVLLLAAGVVAGAVWLIRLERKRRDADPGSGPDTR